MFYTFRQNNSGGSFELNANAGISVCVVIEADDYKEANTLAEKKGIYFNGVVNGHDCACCGDRWDAMYEYDKGSIEPMYWNKPMTFNAKDCEPKEYCLWGRRQNMPEAYVHYKDGRVEARMV